jgi:hypothetical protein
MPVVARYQSIANSNASGHGVLPAVASGHSQTALGRRCREFDADVAVSRAARSRQDLHVSLGCTEAAPPGGHLSRRCHAQMGRWLVGRSQGALCTLPEQTQRYPTAPPVVALVLACGRPGRTDCCTLTTATTNSTECTVVIHAFYKVLPNRFCITQGKSRSS